MAPGAHPRGKIAGRGIFQAGVPAPLAFFKDRQKEIKGEDEVHGDDATISYDAAQPLNDPAQA